MYILAISPGSGFIKDKWLRILECGIDGFMIREKNMNAGLLLETTNWVRHVAPEIDLWVNGRLDVALVAKCGLHAGENYPNVPSRILAPQSGVKPISLSRPLHDPAQMEDRSDSDQLLVSPVFGVPTKGSGIGIEKLKLWLDEMPPYKGRILALGGITTLNAADLQHPKLAGIAVIRALWEAEDPCKRVRELRLLWN